jgi:CRISPR-associated protein Cmr6
MPVAAVPRYLLKQDLSHASPALRFGMYLPAWTDRSDQEREVNKRAQARSPEGQEVAQLLAQRGMGAAIDILRRRERRPLSGLWDKNDFAGREAWKTVSRLTLDDKHRMQAILDRQSALAEPLAAVGQLLTIEARAVAPFTTGLGNEHPLENGFAFLNPYGLPYLPGSGVKGVLRQAASELAGLVDDAQWDKGSEWTAQAIDALFGTKATDGQEHQRGALSFWDVIPRIAGDALLVEVMTAHQTHYFQGKETPHESGQPNPINFLTVPPASDFAFRVQCDRAFLQRLAPDLVWENRWRTLLLVAFEHAFTWLGFGAKTAVGYGAMERDRRAEEAARKQAEIEAERLAREDEARRQREVEAAEAERRQAEYDALPKSEKALLRFQEALEGVSGQPPLDKNRFAVLVGIVNELATQAIRWNEDAARSKAAIAIETAFDRFGWAPSGLKSEKRKKQEARRRNLVDEVRRGAD